MHESLPGFFLQLAARDLHAPDLIPIVDLDADFAVAAWPAHGPVIHLIVELLLRLGGMQRVEPGVPDESVGNHVDPAFQQVGHAAVGHLIRPRSYDLGSDLECGETRPVQVHVQMVDAGRQIAHRCRGYGGVNEAAHGHSAFLKDAQQHAELIRAEHGGYRQHEIAGIAPNELLELPEVQVNQVGVVGGVGNGVGERVRVHAGEVVLVGLARMSAGQAKRGLAEENLVFPHEGDTRRVIGQRLARVQ